MCWSKTLVWHKKTVGEKTFNKKTGRENNLLLRHCSICNRKKFLTVNDNTIAAEGTGNFFKSLGKSSVKVGKKLAKSVFGKSRTSSCFYSKRCWRGCISKP